MSTSFCTTSLPCVLHLGWAKLSPNPCSTHMCSEGDIFWLGKISEFPQLPFSQCLNPLWAPWLPPHPLSLRKVYLSSCAESALHSMLFIFLPWDISDQSLHLQAPLCVSILQHPRRFSPNLKPSQAPSLPDKWLLKAVYFPLVTWKQNGEHSVTLKLM